LSGGNDLTPNWQIGKGELINVPASAVYLYGLPGKILFRAIFLCAWTARTTHMHYKDSGLLIRRAATIISVLILFVVLLFNQCSSKSNARQKDAALDSLKGTAPWFTAMVNVDLIAYSPGEYTLLVKAEAGNSDNKISHDTVSFFVNDRKMEYSVGVGNYYERTPAYHTSFDERSFPGETLTFKIKLKDSTYAIGFLDLRPVMSFVSNKSLYKDFAADRSKAFSIDWGGSLPDSLTIMQVKHVRNGNSTSIESNLLADQHWSSDQPVIIEEKALNSGADTFEIAWWKEGKGINTHKKIFCSINAIARIDQQIKIQ
jgi:hypothetical protein